MAWGERMRDFHARRAKARGVGGPERLARRRASGALSVIRFLARSRARTAGGRHRLAGWPTKF